MLVNVSETFDVIKNYLRTKFEKLYNMEDCSMNFNSIDKANFNKIITFSEGNRASCIYHALGYICITFMQFYLKVKVHQ